MDLMYYLSNRASILATLCLLFLIVSPTSLTSGTTRQGEDKSASTKSGDKKKEKSEATKLLWVEPSDIESRDLFYGIGGKSGAPDTSGRFKFIERKTGGYSPKIIVEDEKGNKWTAKYGSEAKPETAATRIVWAAGYHVDQDYYLKDVQIAGWNGPTQDFRFELDHDGYKSDGGWEWKSNPFLGTREMDGLKVLMALVNNFDLKTDNNKIVHPDKKSGESNEKIYYVNDLGATFGSTGNWFTSIPLIGELPAALFKSAGSKGDPKEYEEGKFIQEIRDGKVYFHFTRRKARKAIGGVKIENAIWMGDILGRLSDKQISDAFRASGFSDNEVSIYLKIVKNRITQLQDLKHSLSAHGTK
jgi:hypothetical protein